MMNKNYKSEQNNTNKKPGIVKKNLKKQNLTSSQINKHGEYKILTSESVNCGHPDKTCDIIADSFLDAALSQDEYSQMAVECAIKDNLLMIYGEATTNAKINYKKIACEVLKEIGYKNKFKIIQKISKQSPQINNAVTKNSEFAANDQGIVYGYATNESKEYMPLTIVISREIMRVYDNYCQHSDNYFRDAKSQVSIVYKNNVPCEVHTVVVSVSHKKGLEHSIIEKDIMDNIVKIVLNQYPSLKTNNTKYIINPSGEFSIWGSFGDSGCVGRKIVADTYGGIGRVGGGCFSSKNATKVDRSGAYYARYVAKNVVAHNLADRCEISVSYAIGLTKPLAINIDTFGSEKVNLDKIYDYVNDNFDFSPSNIMHELSLLLKPIYKQTAWYGHFSNPNYPWEKIKN